MTQKVGTCEGCGARYRIPESFTGTRAKCKKCGGIVHVGEAAAAPPPPPPEPEPEPEAAAEAEAAPAGRPARTSRRAPRSEEPRQKGRAGARRGGRGRTAARSRRGQPAEEAEEEEAVGAGTRRGRGRKAPARKSGNPMLLVGGVGIVLVVGGILAGVFLLGGDDEEGGPAEAASAAGAPDGAAGEPDAGEAGDAAADPESGDGTPADETPPPEEAPPPEEDTATPDPVEPPPEEPPAEPEELPTLIEFEEFGKLPDTSDEEWAEIVEHADALKYGGRGRTRALQSLKDHGVDAIPVLLNTLNGCDLADPTNWMDAFEIARFIQDDLTYEYIRFAFKGDFSEEPADVTYNYKALTSMVSDYWPKKYTDTDSLTRLREKVAEKEANADR